MTALDRFSPATRDWFSASFDSPTEAQTRGWDAIANGDHTLIHAPTGSGKTLAAFLWAIDRLAGEPVPAERQRCRVLYVSPMKALAYDVERNLRAPLTGIQHSAARLGSEPPNLTAALRTGDTPQNERAAMLRHPPDLLITTPESLYLMLTSQRREILRTVRWVIIDEIHSVAGTKRGSHLSLSLERLERITDVSPQRIGLSATQRPLETIAEFMGGGAIEGDSWQPRPVTVIDAPWEKELDVQIVVPVEDMTQPESTVVGGATAGVDPAEDEGARRSIWPAVYPRLLDLVLQHRSTLLFVNSRSLAERLAAELNRLAGDELVQSHHGSVSREQRLEIESRLKSGQLRGVVATSTLELGIDMAAVDLVVLVESPTSVARGLQRVGRAGHQVGAPSVARVFPKHRGDLLETAVVVDRMQKGAIEATTIPSNPLDVLAQQVVAMVADTPQAVGEVFDTVRGAAPYRDLPRSSFDAVLDMLSGRFPSDEFAELRPRLVWDRVEDKLTARGNARMLAVTNAGTIPDRGLYTVSLPEGGKVGELDEEMVYESRPGEVFVLGSSAWKINEITHDRVVVVPAPGETAARLPFWHGDAPGRPLELGRAVGAFIREIGGMEIDAAEALLQSRYQLDPWAASNLYAFLREEREVVGTLATDRTIVVEQFRDEIGDWRTVLLSPFGARVHAPWALAARSRLRERHGSEVDVIWSDDGIVFRFPDIDAPPSTAELIIDPAEVEELVLQEVSDSALFTSKFREAAARALLLPRRRPGSRTPLWLQRRKAANLLEVAKQFGSFPIILETYREVLQDYFDLPALTEVLGDIAQRKVRVAEVSLEGPSPFATSLMFDFIASFMYEYDAPLAERRAAALTLDRDLLRELLGDPQFRELLDPEAVTQVELELQRLAPDRHIRGFDDLHDSLRSLGPLSLAQIEARVEDAGSAPEWVATLTDTRRAVEVRIAGEPRVAAVEDVARLRDALGVAPPQGLPDALLEPVADALGDVVARYARTHGPFGAAEAAATLGLPVAAVNEVLGRLEAEGRVAAGAYRPGGTGQEWVDLDVLRRLRRRSLAALRSEVEAVDGASLARFLPGWHDLGDHPDHPDRLAGIIRQLQGYAMPASVVERDVLPARMRYSARTLDALLASGDVVWIGAGPLGVNDGRVALYRRSQVPLLRGGGLDSSDAPDGPIHHRLRSYLGERGASFWTDLYVGAEGGDPAEVLAALWDLVWAGEVTNDTLAPLRAFLKPRRGARTGKPHLTGATPPAASGRWYLVRDLTDDSVMAEARATATAEQQLERHGIVTRGAVLAESTPGGFSGLYPVLGAMEDTGRVRRGYFVEGLGGAQFGLPGAIDRLRLDSDGSRHVLAATDPANPYGSVLDWPEHPSGRPARRANSYVVTQDGELLALLERGGRSVLLFEAGRADPNAVAAGILTLAQQRPSRFTVERVDGDPITSSVLEAPLLEQGFVVGYKGLSYRPPAGKGRR